MDFYSNFNRYLGRLLKEAVKRSNYSFVHIELDQVQKGHTQNVLVDNKFEFWLVVSNLESFIPFCQFNSTSLFVENGTRVIVSPSSNHKISKMSFFHHPLFAYVKNTFYKLVLLEETRDFSFIHPPLQQHQQQRWRSSRPIMLKGQFRYWFWFNDASSGLSYLNTQPSSSSWSSEWMDGWFIFHLSHLTAMKGWRIQVLSTTATPARATVEDFNISWCQ